MVGLDELTTAVLCRDQEDGQLRFATEQLAFLATLPTWEEAGLRLEKDGIDSHGDSRLMIRRLAGVMERTATDAVDTSGVAKVFVL